jgi:hypothetical protein
VGHGTPSRGAIERPEYLDRADYSIGRSLSIKNEGLQKHRCELPYGARAGPNDVNRVIRAWPQQPGRLVDAGPEASLFGQTPCVRACALGPPTASL